VGAFRGLRVDAEPYTLGVGGHAGDRLAAGQCGVPRPTLSFGYDRGPQREHGRAVDSKGSHYAVPG
jgi:hypothetical protein